MDLQFYIAKTTDVYKLAELRAQWHSASNLGFIECAGCGLKRDLTLAYKCLYCGVWYCFTCGEFHFGQTVADYYKAKK